MMDRDHTITPPVTPPLKNPLVGFRIHAIVFVLTVLLLTLLNAGLGGEDWVQYVILGWGIGLIAHGAAAALKWGAQRGQV